MAIFSRIRSVVWTVPLIVATTAVMGVWALVRSNMEKPEGLLFEMGRRWGRLIVRICGSTVRVAGLENLPSSGSYIFISNHLSNLDVPAMLPYLPFPVRFLAKSELFTVPIFGTCLRRAGHFSVELEDIRSQFRSMAKVAQAVREQGLSAFVFPEGSRSTQGLDEFKEGAAYIAIKAQVPVIPMAICGTGDAVPPGSIHIRGRQIGLRFGTPISTAGLDTKDRALLTRQMYEAVAALLVQCKAATPA